MFPIGREDFGVVAAEVLRSGRSLTFVAGGSSMSPFIRDGDSVVLETVGEGVKVGEVVLLSGGDGRLILHRVVGRTKEGVVTRGDSCLSDDGHFPFDSILGRVKRVTGSGYNFHLRFPVRRLVSIRTFSPANLRRHRLFWNLCREIVGIFSRSERSIRSS